MDKYTTDLIKLIDNFDGLTLNTNDFVTEAEKVRQEFKNSCIHSEELIKFWRFKSDKSIKWYKEELVYISTFLKSQSRFTGYTVRPIRGNQSYDAILENSSNKIYIEVTLAVDGHMERRQNEHLEKYGHSPVTIENPETFKNDRCLSQEYSADAVDVGESIENEIKKIETAISKKMENQNYTERFILIVGYSPGFPERFNEVKGRIKITNTSTAIEEIFVVDAWEYKVIRVSP